MSNWLDKAMGRETPEMAPVPFEIDCACGLRTSGMRGERGRRVICASCGEAYFILPVNQYPTCERKYFDVLPVISTPDGDLPDVPADTEELEPSGSESSTPAKAEPPSKSPPTPEYRYVISDCDDDDGEDVEDFFAADLDEHRRKKPDADSKEPFALPRLKSDKSAKRRPVAASRRVKGSDNWLSSSVNDERADTRKRLALVAAAFGLVICMTGVWILRNNSRDKAETQLRLGAERGLAAFEAGDYLTAERELAEAIAALDQLGRDSHEGHRLRLVYRQAQGMAGLLDGDLAEVVNAAQRGTDFDSLYRGKWIIADQQPLLIQPAPVLPPEASRDKDGPVGGRRLEWPIPVDGRPVSLAGTESLLAKLESAGPLSRMIFGGRIKACRLDEAAAVWVLELDPESVFLCSRFDMLDRRGLVSSDDAVTLRLVIENQAAVVGDTPAESKALAGTGASDAKK